MTVPPPLAPILPQAYCQPASHTRLLPGGDAPTNAGAADAADGEGDSVGDATGLTRASDATTSAEEAEAEEVAIVASSCIAPAGPAVVDEHPATAAVTGTTPTVSNFTRGVKPFPLSKDRDANHPDGHLTHHNQSRSPETHI